MPGAAIPTNARTHARRATRHATTLNPGGNSVDDMSAPAEEHPDPLAHLLVSDEEQRTIAQTVRLTDKLQELMNLSYDMVPVVPYGKGVFLYQGKRVQGDKTPADYKMETVDHIDFYSEMKPDMFVLLLVKNKAGRALIRTMRKTDRMKDLLDFSCAMFDVPVNRGRLTFSGKKVTIEKTPEGLSMKDWDEVMFDLTT